MKKVFLLLIAAFISIQINAQNYKFGKVSKEELEEKVYPLDSSANAAYLYKKRRTYTTVLGGKIQLITEVQVRLKIYTSEGYDWATEKIQLYSPSNSDSENMSSLKAVTYNLVDGKIEETKLNKKEVYSENLSGSFKETKFTMPNLKEGSVVEWSYKLYSPYFFSIDDIMIQYKIPVKKYYTKIELLEWLNFNKRQKGYYPFRIKETAELNHDFKTNDKIIIIDEENIPAIKDEPYVNNLYNYAAGLQLEVASLSAPELGLFENYATSWEEIAKDISKNSYFGGELKKTGHLKDDIAILKSELTTLPAKILGSLQYVKNKIKWNGNIDKYTDKGLRKAYKEGIGNIGDINLTLVAVLRGVGLNANPVLVSTRSNGVPIFPTKRGFNYVIASVESSQGTILLDASDEYSVPNVLPVRALNWQGRIVRDNGTSSWVQLTPKEYASAFSTMQIVLDSEGTFEGLNRTQYSNLKALNYRNDYGKLKEEEIKLKVEESNGSLEISNFKLTNKNEAVKPIVEMYKFTIEDKVDIVGDKMYFKSLILNATEENPFKLEDRQFPIDFASPILEKKVVSITIPEGYVVESIPESIGVGLPNEYGLYKFDVNVTGNKINVYSIFQINTAIYPAQFYQEIKDFYKVMVNKNLEQIVLKKA